MNDMIDSTTDKKNIGLLKNLLLLRQALDVYCVVSVNADAIKNVGIGNGFFGFVQGACLRLIFLHICKIFEEEALDKKRGVARHELDSIDGVLRDIDKRTPGILDSDRIRDFVQKYTPGSDECGVAAISAVIRAFRQEHKEVLGRFATLRHKWVAHGESGFIVTDGPSYDYMERLFNFGLDFYMLVSEAIVSVGPVDLNSDRRVRTSLVRMLKTLGCENIRTDMG